MQSSSRNGQYLCMRLTYAVLWQARGGPIQVGRLGVSHDGITLDGGARNGGEMAESVLHTKISAVRIEREVTQRLAGLPTLVLTVLGDEIYRIASVDGPGTLGEMAGALAREVVVRS